jgi:drug/metabolite transporter (DMT)-like permease
MAKGETGAIAIIVLVMLIWGSTFTVTKLVNKEVSPIQFAFLRFVVASVVLIPVLSGV